jgi:hypothetical protein
VPKQSGTGGKTWLGRISKRDDGYLRRLLVTGALTALTRSKAVKAMPWIIGMKARAKRPMVIAVALANKMARTAWAMMVRATVPRLAGLISLQPPFTGESTACADETRRWSSRSTRRSREACGIHRTSSSVK